MTQDCYYVYFIQKGYGSIKIGVAKNPEARLKNLQTGNHGKLYLIAKFPCASVAAARNLESDLHKKFERFRLEGEWFRKSILREFKDRSKIFPHIFRKSMAKGEKFNSYHK